MKIVVFGASGKVGQKVVKKLLAQGHTVRATVYGRDPFENKKNLETTKVDVHNAEDVRKALGGADLVISTLGSWGTTSKDILSSGMKTIVPAMEEMNIKRIVSLTGAGAMDSNDKPSIMDKASRPLLMLAASKILKDGEQHIAILRSSTLDWTVLRSPVMREGVKTGKYKLSLCSPALWATILRDDVADAMVMIALSNKHLKSAPFIKRT